MKVNEELIQFKENERFNYYVTKNGEVFRVSKKHPEKIYQMKIGYSVNGNTEYYFISIYGDKTSMVKIMFDVFFSHLGEYKDYWCFFKDGKNDNFKVSNLEFIKRQKKKILDNPQSKKVIFINLETKKGIVYNSITRCSNALGYTSIYVSKIINSIQSFSNFDFKNKIMFYDDYLELKEKVKRRKSA